MSERLRSGLIATKLGMSCYYNERGERVPVTLLQVDDCQVVDHKTLEKNGYSAVVIGSSNISKVSKPLQKFYESKKLHPKRKLKEFRVSEENLLEIGKELKPSFFVPGQFVDVSGKSIGKGFAGAMKRHGFRGLEASHGTSISHRSHGSTGQCQDPGKVFKGKKMAGHMGSVAVTIQNLTIVQVDDEKSIIVVAGSIPGPKGLYVVIRDSVKKAGSI
jgi:large subunit ribosomal protein L3